MQPLSFSQLEQRSFAANADYVARMRQAPRSLPAVQQQQPRSILQNRELHTPNDIAALDALRRMTASSVLVLERASHHQPRHGMGNSVMSAAARSSRGSTNGEEGESYE